MQDDGPSKSGGKDEDYGFEHAVRNGNRKRQSKTPGPEDGDTDNEQQKKLIKYVITNPDKDLVLQEGDSVFVLA